MDCIRSVRPSGGYRRLAAPVTLAACTAAASAAACVDFVNGMARCLRNILRSQMRTVALVVCLVALSLAAQPAAAHPDGETEVNSNWADMIQLCAWAGLCCPSHGNSYAPGQLVQFGSNSWRKTDIYNATSGTQTITFSQRMSVGSMWVDSQGAEKMKKVRNRDADNLICVIPGGAWLSGTEDGSGTPVDLGGTSSLNAFAHTDLYIGIAHALQEHNQSLSLTP